MWGVMQRPCKLQRKETHVSHLDLDQATHNQCGNCLPWEIYLLEICLHDPLHVRRCAMLAQRAREISIIAWIIADNKFGQRPKVGGGDLLMLRSASCGVKRLSIWRNEDMLASTKYLFFYIQLLGRHWFCTSASYDNQPNGCQTHRHWCNSIVFDCYIIKLQRRRDHTSAGEVHNLATWCPNCYFGLAKGKAKTRQL